MCFCKQLDGLGCKYTLLDLSGRVSEVTRTQYSAQSNKRIKMHLLNNNFIRLVANAVYSKKTIKSNEECLEYQYDAAVFDGGSLFMDYFSFRIYRLLRVLRRKKIPVYFNACGMSTFCFKIEQFVLSKALHFENVKYISVRDSQDRFQKVFSIDPIKTNDIALTISDVIKNNNDTRKTIIGIGYIYRIDRNDIIQNNIYRVIEILEKNNINWELFTNGDGTDYSHASIFYQKLCSKSNIKNGKLCRRPISVNDLIDDITRFKWIITGRLHSAIIAYSYMIPAACISWDNKIRDFYSTINHPELVLDFEFDPVKTFEMMKTLEYTSADLNHLITLKRDAKTNIETIVSKIQQSKDLI